MKLFSRPFSKLAREINSDAVYGEWIWAYVLLAVDIGWSIVFLFYPLLKGLWFSFNDVGITGDMSWVGLGNFTDILTDLSGWWYSFRVTLYWMIGVVPMTGIIIPLLLALLVSPLSASSQNLFKAAFYLPGVISPVVSAMIIRWIFNPTSGLANWMMRNLGLPEKVWFADPQLALPALIVMTWLGGHGWGMILYLAAVDRIPKSLYEAADLDSASWWSKVRNITWPLIKPMTLFTLVTGLIGGFQVFAPAFLITQGGPMRTTEFVGYRIYTTFFARAQFGMASAMAVVMMVIIVAVSVASWKLLSTDVEY